MSGELVLITGCMFCGKTEELLRRVKREMIAGRKVQLFKPGIDTRYSADEIASHDSGRLKAEVVSSSEDIRAALKKDTEVIGIDELHFFDDGIIGLCIEQVRAGKHVVASGLNLDFRGEPFRFRGSEKNVGELMPYATNITLKAVCTHKEQDGRICGMPATMSQRLINGKPAKRSDPLILVGAKDCYEARCREHYVVPE